MNDTTDTDLVDFLDLINFTLKEEFIDRWKYRFSPLFLKEFQLKILGSLQNRKPLKIKSLYNHLSKKCGYSQDQVENFFDAVDISLYYPVVIGKII